MAEYTIPKPYRDFYVTNPYIELKESNERLQRIVKNGYVATDSFDGHTNKVIMFDEKKHGFSITNEGVANVATSFNLKNESLWKNETIDTTTGFESQNNYRLDTDYLPVLPSGTYKITLSPITNTYQFIYLKYDANKTLLSYAGWVASSPHTVTLDSNVAYIRFLVKQDDGVSQAISITPSSFIADLDTFTLERTSSLPSDVTVKVAENVAGIPTTADGWEQGGFSSSTGIPEGNLYRVRSKDYIDVLPITSYTFRAYFSGVICKIYVFEYDSKGSFIKNSIVFTETPCTIITSSETTQIKIAFASSEGTKITPNDFVSNLTNLYITSDTMIVTENDTRIVTMPPFTSLYIESNVPYHGHALDLAE